MGILIKLSGGPLDGQGRFVEQAILDRGVIRFPVGTIDRELYGTDHLPPIRTVTYRRGQIFRDTFYYTSEES